MTLNTAIKFCNLCGESIRVEIPDGDNRPRHVCISCGEIQYQNPKVIAGCIPTWSDKILLCKRAIEPRLGLWTVPAGFMENNETLQEGAKRETQEEAYAPMANVELFGVYNLPHISQIYVIFRGELLSQDGFGIGEESLEVRLFSENEIPWEQLAFRVVEKSLRRFLVERNGNNFGIELDDIYLQK